VDRRLDESRCRLAGVPSHVPAIARVIDAAARKGVDLQVVTFSQSTHTAEEAAHAVGAELGQIVKSLVFIAPGSDGPEACLALVSGSNTVDMSRLAAVLAEPHIRRATADEARQLTGFVIGGIPPFGHRHQMRTVMDPDLGRFATVWASAGTPTAVFEIPPGTLRTLANATVAPIAREQGGGGRRPDEGQATGASSAS
jgi:Cys-tRNA(Pro) deacylase